MAEFLVTEAIDVDTDDNDNNSNVGNNDNIATVSDDEFIDDSEQPENPNDFYPYFTNVSISYDEAMRDSENVDDLEARNYFDSDEEEQEIHDFSNFEARIKSFKDSLINPHGLENPDSFFYSILYAIRYKETNKVDYVDQEQNLKQDVGLALSHDLFEIKSMLRLDLDVLNFENQCFKINTILSRHGMFLRVFELKDKFRYVFKQNSEQKKIISEVSACIIERFNGFTIVRIEFDNEIRTEFSPIDIIYKPVKKQNEILNCFFTDKLHLAYRATYNECQRDTTKNACVYPCHFCNKFFIRKARWTTHMQNCTGKPGFVYNFQTRNLLTFEENIKFKRDVPLTAYIDFETTAPTDDYLDPECNKMNVVSFVIIFAFNPKLLLPRVIIERSFGHSLEKLCHIDYLTAEQLKYKDNITLKQLRDCALAVHEKTNLLAVSEMFCTEIKFATDCLLRWYNSKYKQLELNEDKKSKYEQENPADWDDDVCFFCKFPLQTNPLLYEKEDENEKKMTYGEFVIKKEHMFLRNVFSKEELSKSLSIATYQAFYNSFIEFLEIVDFLYDKIESSMRFSDCAYHHQSRFIRKHFSDFGTFNEIKQEIENVEIKGYANSKIPKFKLQLYAFVYDKVMKFPSSKFECKTVTTVNLFQSVYRILNVKVHLHHSHVTGEIKGYAHDFCNWTVRENYDVVPCIAHNFFKFDMFFLLKGIRLSVWRTKDINIGGNNMTDINYAEIGNFKFIDSIKYYQTSLAKLAETMSDVEKDNIANLVQQFIATHSYFSGVWKDMDFWQKKRVIDIVVSGKGIIPYEKVETIKSLSCKPENGVFFTKDEFYSSLKAESVDETSYDNAKTLFLTLKMRDLSDLNDLYNAQDVIILLEIIENRFQQIQDMTDYNPRILNSASKLSGCIQREKSKCIIALPTDNVQMEIFEKTVCGGYSSVNNRLSFDTELLMPNLSRKDYDKMNIDQSFYAFKRDDLKLGYMLKLDNYNEYKRKRVITKIVKFDENNQYGYAMTRPMPTGCIKQNAYPSWVTFNLLIEKVSFEDVIGHLFVVDIEFDFENASARQLMYNEIFPPIIEKKKIMEANERSLFQLLEVFSKTEKGKPRSYVCTAKSHATLLPKICIPLYIEDLRFLIKRAGWKVTKLYSHFTFEQDTFKKDFVLMNQKARQNAKNDIEKNFYKLMNNANFGFDCRNDADSLKFQPLIDEMNELTFIKKYHNLFDYKVKQFVSSEILNEFAEQNYTQGLFEIKDDDPYRDLRLSQLKNKKQLDLDAIECFKRQERKNRKRIVKDDFNERTADLLKDRKIKTMIDFEYNNSNSIKSLAIKKNNNVKVTSRFIKGKMLMFAKLSIKSFVYDMIDVFCFPNTDIQSIYDSYHIEKCFLYQNLTDTDSTSLLFLFICDLQCVLPESEARKVIFECMIKSKILERLDVSDEFWKQFDVHNVKTKKQMGLFEIENIDNPNVCTIAVNPKEYFEKFKDKTINKKHKGVRKATPGMMFENYANRIKRLRYDLNQSDSIESFKQKRLEVRNTNMKMTTVNKVKFARLNDKRYYFSDGIVSLPFGHILLDKVRKYKKQLTKIHEQIDEEKDTILQYENEAVMQNERLRILRSIFSQQLVYYDLHSHKIVSTGIIRPCKYATTKDYLLNSHWL